MSEYLRKRQETAPGAPKPEPIPAEGVHVGTIEGLAGRLSIPLAELPVVVAEPEPHDRASTRWWAIRYHPVKQADDRVANVVCFTCDAIYSGRWYQRETEAGPELRPYIGGGVVGVGGELRACPCDAGQPWASSFPLATFEECRAIEALAIEDHKQRTDQ